MTESRRDALLAQIDTVPFTPLAPHAGRNALFLVAADTELVDVALAVAENRTSDVEALIARGALRRPTAEEVTRFAAEPDAHAFRFVIVQPFVLAQSVI
jgi:hypothetical protein